MKKTYILLFTAIVVFISQSSIIAQNIVTHQVIVCSGGDFNNANDFVTVAAYSPVSKQTVVFDTIYTQSVQDIIIDNEIAFVAAQDSIVKYDMNTYKRLATIEANGVHKLAIKDEILIATFWYPETSGFVKTYFTSDLSLKFTFDEVSGESAGIFAFPGDLYSVIAVPGGWDNSNGKLAWLDIDNNTFVSEDNMGGYGNGVNFFVTFDTGFPNFAAITKTPWGDSTFNVYGFTVIGQATGVYTFNAVMQGYTGQKNTILYAQINDGIGQLDLENHKIEDQLIIEPTSLTIASSVYDSVNSLFYLATTDYSTIGVGMIYNIAGEAIGNFDTGISPEAIAIDYRESTGIKDFYIESKIKIYPNPSSGVVTVEVCNGIYPDHFNIIDISGRELNKGKIRLKNRAVNIDISSLQRGLYFLILSDRHKKFTVSFIKN